MDSYKKNIGQRIHVGIVLGVTLLLHFTPSRDHIDADLVGM